jgi:hypothetical protein
MSRDLDRNSAGSRAAPNEEALAITLHLSDSHSTAVGVVDPN